MTKPVSSRILVVVFFAAVFTGVDNDWSFPSVIHAEPSKSHTAAAEASSEFIVIDQFGYRPGDTKVAVIRSPEVGYDSAKKFQPGNKYELRRLSDDVVVFEAAPTMWNKGAVEDSSG